MGTLNPVASHSNELFKSTLYSLHKFKKIVMGKFDIWTNKIFSAPLVPVKTMVFFLLFYPSGRRQEKGRKSAFMWAHSCVHRKLHMWQFLGVSADFKQAVLQAKELVLLKLYF